MGSFTPIESLLFNIVLGTLAVGLPVVLVLLVRFLWDRNLNLGRSKELEKLIWQLHRIASAMEHQMNLSFPAVQPGTEEARDLAYLQRGVAAPAAATVAAPVSVAVPAVGAATRATHAPVLQPSPVQALAAPQPAMQHAAAQAAAIQTPVPQPAAVQPAVAPAAAEEPEGLPALERRDPSVQAPRAGVNSMFGL